MYRLLSPSYWFGPLFHLELTRLARRGLHNPLRWGLGLVLLVVLFVFYSKWFPSQDPISLLAGADAQLQIGQMARFAESFVFALLIVQLCVVVALAPFLAAGSIVEERRKQTMEFLLMSPLTEREIVLGKLAARLVYVAAILFAVLPILTLMQFWGGIDLTRVICGYLVIGFTLVSLGGMSIYFAVETKSLGGALGRVYGWFLLITICSYLCSCGSFIGGVVSPFVCLWGVFDSSGWRELEIDESGLTYASLILLALFMIVHGLIAFVMIRAAGNRLRNRSLAISLLIERIHERDASDFIELLKSDAAPANQSEFAVLTKREENAKVPPPKATPRPVKARSRSRAIDENDPLVWKERHFPRPSDPWSLQGRILVWFILLLTAFSVFAAAFSMNLLIALDTNEPIGPSCNPTICWAGLFMFGYWCFAAAWRTISSLTREREEQTLESLLTLPVSRSEILAAKWRAGLRQGKWMGRSLLALVVFGGIIASLHLAVLPLVAIFALVFRLFLNTLGLWLSTTCRTTLRAQVWLVILLTVICAGPYLLAEVGETVFRAQHAYDLAWDLRPRAERGAAARKALALDEVIAEQEATTIGFSPIVSWRALMFSWRDLEREQTGYARYRAEKFERPGTVRQLRSAFFATLVFLVLAGVLWLDARRRFAKEGL